MYYYRDNLEKKFPNRVRLKDLSDIGLRMMGWPEYRRTADLAQCPLP